MKTHAAIAALAVASVLFVPGRAVQAAPSCGKRADIVERLAAQYDEKPVRVGVVGQATILEVFVSGNGTFTIVVTRADGISCLLAAGTDWQSAPTASKGGV